MPWKPKFTDVGLVPPPVPVAVATSSAVPLKVGSTVPSAVVGVRVHASLSMRPTELYLKPVAPLLCWVTKKVSVSATVKVDDAKPQAPSRLKMSQNVVASSPALGK